MVNEADDSGGYTDDTLEAMIEAYPLLDVEGRDPSETDWVSSYDLHAVAAEVWEEKAGVVAQDFTFSADGGTFQRSQVYQQYMQLAQYHRARRNLSSGRMVAYPTEPDPALWIGNLPEPD